MKISEQERILLSLWASTPHDSAEFFNGKGSFPRVRRKLCLYSCFRSYGVFSGVDELKLQRSLNLRNLKMLYDELMLLKWTFIKPKVGKIPFREIYKKVAVRLLRIKTRLYKHLLGFVPSDITETCPQFPHNLISMPQLKPFTYFANYQKSPTQSLLYTWYVKNKLKSFGTVDRANQSGLLETPFILPLLFTEPEEAMLSISRAGPTFC